jgi:hypothetical protein
VRKLKQKHFKLLINKKEDYLRPEIEVSDLCFEGCIAVSGPASARPSTEDWGEGNTDWL